MAKIFDGIEAPCCQGGQHGCACSSQERVLRAIASGRIQYPMTDDERTWCKDEIEWYGGYSVDDDISDQALAREVLNVWGNYVCSIL